MPRDLRNDREYAIYCAPGTLSPEEVDRLYAGDVVTHQSPELSWFYADLAVIGIACLVALGFVVGWL